MRGLIIFVIFALWVEASSALAVKTRDMNFVSQLAFAIEIYQKQHAGAFPTKWSDLDVYFEGGVAQGAKHVQGTDRYVLLSPPVPFSEPFEGELIVVSRRAFNDVSHYTKWLGGIGRRVGPPRYYAVLPRIEATFCSTGSPRTRYRPFMRARACQGSLLARYLNEITLQRFVESCSSNVSSGMVH